MDALGHRAFCCGLDGKTAGNRNLQCSHGQAGRKYENMEVSHEHSTISANLYSPAHTITMPSDTFIVFVCPKARLMSPHMLRIVSQAHRLCNPDVQASVSSLHAARGCDAMACLTGIRAFVTDCTVQLTRRLAHPHTGSPN